MVETKETTTETDEECSQVRAVGGNIPGFKTFIKEDGIWSNIGTKEKFGSIEDIKNHYTQKGKRKVLVMCE